jgi:anthranilate synthase component 1
MAVAVEPAALPVSPSLDEVRELAREHNLVPLRHTFIDDCETPVAAFLKLRGTEPQSPAFLLESAEQGQRVGRY